ncbi:MAG: hypothetical protein ACJ8F1_20440 [Polyangia bacterium]
MATLRAFTSPRSRHISWLGIYLTLAVAAMAVAFAGCGNSTVNAISTGAGGGGGNGVICTVAGATCSTDAQCCSHACDPVAHTCGSSVGTCSGPGSSCGVATDCCNLQCDTSRGVCSTAAACTADGASCSSSATCCSGNCSGGTCAALNAACRTAGNPCSAAGDCCSGLCTGGTCVLGASFCIQPGDVCARDTDCCGGSCAKASGATLGVCQDVATTGAGSCVHDGVLCNGCGSCCSRNCGPWALTGVNVCQPGLGCKILNSLCTTDQECCGGSGTSPEVTCTAAVSASGNATIGVCAQNHGNQVPGGICKLSGNANACSNAESDCECAVSPKAQCCAYDTLGLPRCLGSGACPDGSTGIFSGTDPKCCRPAGQTCNTAAECCGLAPCVPDSTGVRHCLAPKPDGGLVCVASGGTCTATGDCCTGLVCNITPGAPSGKCGPPPTPSGGGVCALYGQACNAATPCCNNVQCTYSPTNMPCNGQTGCTCYSPITIGFQGAP